MTPLVGLRFAEMTEENSALRDRLTGLEDDLASARTSLRRMMRTENTTQ
ncbi:hypothetical protein [Streptomyces natalensis]|nr:hypothetical protein [Streptomyces natalensis]